MILQAPHSTHTCFALFHDCTNCLNDTIKPKIRLVSVNAYAKDESLEAFVIAGTSSPSPACNLTSTNGQKRSAPPPSHKKPGSLFCVAAAGWV